MAGQRQRHDIRQLAGSLIIALGRELQFPSGKSVISTLNGHSK